MFDGHHVGDLIGTDFLLRFTCFQRFGKGLGFFFVGTVRLSAACVRAATVTVGADESGEIVQACRSGSNGDDDEYSDDGSASGSPALVPFVAIRFFRLNGLGGGTRVFFAELFA